MHSIPLLPAITTHPARALALPTGPTLYLPPRAGQKLLSAPPIAGLLPAQILVSPLQIIDTVSPTTSEITRVPALIFTDPRLATLDPVLLSRANDDLRLYFGQVVDYLTGQRAHSTFATDGAVLLGNLSRALINQPNPLPRRRADTYIAQRIAPSQASAAQSNREQCNRLVRLLVEWGVCPQVPPLSTPEYVIGPWKYTLSTLHPTGVIVHRRHPNPSRYLKGRCVTSAGELIALKADMEAAYTAEEIAMQRRIGVSKPAEVFVTTAGSPAPNDLEAQITARATQRLDQHKAENAAFIQERILHATAAR